MTMDAKPIGLLWTQIFRVIFGVLLALPFFVFYFAWHVVNQSYHPATYDPASFWLNAAALLVPIAVIGLFLAFWRFGSKQVGQRALGIAAVAFLAMLIWVASNL